MFKRQTAVNLSFQDKYILAFESHRIHFNSHLILEIEHHVDIPKLKEAFRKLFELEPLTRLVADEKVGKFYQVPFDEIDIEKQFFQINEEILEAFWDRKFNFFEEVGIRLAVIENLNKTKLIFSFHHSLFDGHAQVIYLKDFLDVYMGEVYKPRTNKDLYQFRKYFKGTSLKWIFDFISDGFKRKKKYKGKVKIARLVDQEPQTRKVDFELIELDRSVLDKGARKELLSMSSYISLVGAKAMDKLLSERGDTKSPIVLFITKSMRFELKITRLYQNILGFIWMKLDRDHLKEKDYGKFFRDTYKFRNGENEVRKTLFVAGLIVKLFSYKKLQRILKNKEERTIDCTLIVSSGRTPPEVKFPEEWSISKLYAKGTMHRCPGIGLMVTSYKNKDFIVIEYLRDAFNVETIKKFKEYILAELT